MSTHFVRFRSEALGRNGEFYIHLPPNPIPFFMQDNPHYKRATKTLILLHGYSGDCCDWLYNTPASDFCMKYNLAVVMPSGGVSFYVDKAAVGHKYGTFIGVDLISYLRTTFNLAKTKEDTFICGNSMGGFGAIHSALMYPETFGGAIGLSSALIINHLHLMKHELPDSRTANLEYYIDTFGDLDKAKESDHNPEVLFKRNKEAGIPNPRIFMACGTEDFLIEANRELRDFLKENEADFEYFEGPGIHDWEFWIPNAYKGIEYLLDEK